MKKKTGIIIGIVAAVLILSAIFAGVAVRGKSGQEDGNVTGILQVEIPPMGL